MHIFVLLYIYLFISFNFHTLYLFKLNFLISLKLKRNQDDFSRGGSLAW
jgi:hypothetical protein